MPPKPKERPVCARPGCERRVAEMRNRYCSQSCHAQSRPDLIEMGRKGGTAAWDHFAGKKWQALVARRRDLLDELVPQQGYFSRQEVKALVNRGISLGYNNGWKAARQARGQAA